MKKDIKIEKAIRLAFKIPRSVSDDQFIKWCKNKIKKYCKPCWELKYCPYGDLVEDFPLIPLRIEEAKEFYDEINGYLQSNKNKNGKKLSKKDKEAYELIMQAYDPKRFIKNEAPKFLIEMSCNIFGHICPIFYKGEEFTETKELRNNSRNIPRDVLIKVLRRDQQVCQLCHEWVPETDIHLDHIIPISKGGPTSVDNLRVLCSSCNLKKLDSISEIIDEEPLLKHFDK